MFEVGSTLDLELLRTFQVVAQSGSLAATAEVRHRTLSAISMQMKRLETELDVRLLERGPRGVTLTASGELLLREAQALLRAHDTLVSRFSRERLSGRVRLGIPEDYARELLDDTLPQFMARHPGILLDVTTDTSGRLARGLRARRLDLAVVLDHAAGLEGGETLWHPTPVWAGPAQGALHQEAIVPLAVHPAECPYRQLAADALDAAQRPWRAIFTSTSIHAVEKAIETGMAIGVLDRERVTGAMRALDENDGLPALRRCVARLHFARTIAAASQPAVEALAELLRQRLSGRGPWQWDALSARSPG
ncbi:LysR family transcriptional regulator [Salinicola endophyticus]|uniref:LysR family transcriptional regulator n=1 Tax=Salinicola endophyticus TaxID=1949083 RepID=A0ABY8FDU7_9GAMM|nr:LysR family transcriptional regulator [Salinicola endophyticus]WFF40998.1 LysR family transcriptional regulator [Salinicola endophyticus]